jgi:hypothetical protein
MRAVLGLLGIVLALGIGQFIYRSYFIGPAGETLMQGTQSPRALADVTGVKNDLLSMAQAERAYMALNGRYASLDELYRSGDLTLDPTRSRDGYSYSVQYGDRNFVITASYGGNVAGMPTLRINETMQITQE